MDSSSIVSIMGCCLARDRKEVQLDIETLLTGIPRDSAAVRPAEHDDALPPVEGEAAPKTTVVAAEASMVQSSQVIPQPPRPVGMELLNAPRWQPLDLSRLHAKFTVRSEMTSVDAQLGPTDPPQADVVTSVATSGPPTRTAAEPPAANAQVAPEAQQTDAAAVSAVVAPVRKFAHRRRGSYTDAEMRQGMADGARALGLPAPELPMTRPAPLAAAHSEASASTGLGSGSNSPTSSGSSSSASIDAMPDSGMLVLHALRQPYDLSLHYEYLTYASLEGSAPHAAAGALKFRISDLPIVLEYDACDLTWASWEEQVKAIELSKPEDSDDGEFC
eukprot:TRINITY_DN22045_c0_g1_i1.p1 TRINITY_DN22045_c0_g1~~TRINITY_DN22045_c0_g1_i1.p1  ORF type:complete len:353 (-),score=50.74 TRINITY_DN22045_c0_g1_i1:192-1187(-)